MYEGQLELIVASRLTLSTLRRILYWIVFWWSRWKGNYSQVQYCFTKSNKQQRRIINAPNILIDLLIEKLFVPESSITYDWFGLTNIMRLFMYCSLSLFFIVIFEENLQRYNS